MTFEIYGYAIHPHVPTLLLFSIPGYVITFLSSLLIRRRGKMEGAIVKLALSDVLILVCMQTYLIELPRRLDFGRVDYRILDVVWAVSVFSVPLLWAIAKTKTYGQPFWKEILYFMFAVTVALVPLIIIQPMCGCE